MKRVNIFLIILALMLICSTAQAQFGERLGRSVQRSAENAAIRKAEQKTEQAVSDAIDKATDPNSYKDDDSDDSKIESSNPPSNQNAGNSNQNNNTENTQATTSGQKPQSETKSLEMSFAKSDFVPGDEIILDDDVSRERMGEFPSQWDLLRGNAEIAKVGGENAILFRADTEITPLMKTPKNYLPESFTIEFDFYVVPQEIDGYWKFILKEPDGNNDVVTFEWWARADVNRRIETSWLSTSGDWRYSDVPADLSQVGWHRLSLSFNQRALKIYVDGVRVVNVPNVTQSGWFTASAGQTWGADGFFLRNIRIAKGAVPLYDRMMSDGKFITYGITFDVGKSTLKPESMGEINRIVTLMKENSDLKFSVEGHTDNTGNITSNQTLSEARSAAVVNKLVENGISKDRLKAAGKGQTSPIADNSSDEGRAKNRRVEFVKIN